jgi:hypothetical protein
MKPIQNTGTILDNIEGEIRDDGKFVVSHWPEPHVSGGGGFFDGLLEIAKREARERKAAA